MQPQELINSGTLELYVAGVLSPAEMARVAGLVAADVVLQKEVAAIEQAMLASLNDQPEAPSAAVRSQVLHAINQTEGTSAKVVNISFWRPLAIAASTLFLISTTIAFLFYNRSNNDRQQYLATLRNNAALQLQQQYVMQTSLMNQQSMDVMHNTQFKKFELLAVNKQLEGQHACMYCSTKTGEIWMDNCGLPKAAAGKCYQLWGIVDGKPVSAGVFSPNLNGLLVQKMQFIPGAVAYAISMEAQGGVVSPTVSEIKVSATL